MDGWVRWKSPFGDGWTWQVRTVVSFRECISKSEFHHFLLWISALPPPVRWPGLTGDVAQYEAACKSLARHAHRLSPERLVKAVDAWKDSSDFWLASVVFQVTPREWCQRVFNFHIDLRKWSDFTNIFSNRSKAPTSAFFETWFVMVYPGNLGRWWEFHLCQLFLVKKLKFLYGAWFWINEARFVGTFPKKIQTCIMVKNLDDVSIGGDVHQTKWKGDMSLWYQR